MVWGLPEVTLPIVCLLVACTLPSSPSFDPAPPLPEAAGSNVLVVLLDDVGTDRIASYGTHPTPARTPVIDQLATQGIRFSRAYAYSTCSPTRAALLTGRHGRRTGIGYNVRDRAKIGLSFDETTIPELLDEAITPYHSVGIGKWHLEPRSIATLDHPRAHGFDTYVGNISNLLKTESYTDYAWYGADGVRQEHARTYLTTREVDAALEYVAGTPEPWFVYLALHAPHYPWAAPPDDLLAEPLPEDPTEADLYDAMLEAADTEIGRLMAGVDLTDTVVMVIGDNGTPDETVRPPSDPARAKNTMFEGGIHVPWVVVGAGVSGGRVVDELVSIVDVFPTVAAVAGLDPVRSGTPIDGRSLWPLLQDTPHEPRTTLFIEKYFPNSKREASWTAVLDDRYKWIRSDQGFEGLYDLRERDVEGPNLLPTPSAEASAAHDRLQAELQRLEAGFAPPTTGCGG